jgi:hypothetical protein
MSQLMNGLEDLTKTTGAAIAFGAHFSKGNQASKESIDRISGSGVFARDPDSILTFTKHEQEGAFTVDSILRNFKPVEPFVCRWDFPLFRKDGALDPARLKQAKGGRVPQFTENDLLEVLPKKGMATADWLKKAGNERGITRATFFRLLKGLQVSKTIEKNDDLRWVVSQVSKGLK